MRIGEIARRSGVAASTIRYYEDQTILAKPARTPAGYREYTTRALDELSFICRAQSLGLALDEIREILALGRSGRKPCARVTAICSAHLDEIDRRMSELQAFRLRLLQARDLAQKECGFTAEGFCRAIFAEPRAR